MSNIIWKPLIYQGDVYHNFEVSNDGQLRNAKTQHVYKTWVNHQGYVQVGVSLGSRDSKKVFKIHKAVAETFIPNPENKPQVNHKDCNKQNNHVENLEWATRNENMQHAVDNGLIVHLCGTDNSQAKFSIEDIENIRKCYIPGDAEYGSRALSRKYGVAHGTILDIVNMIAYANH